MTADKLLSFGHTGTCGDIGRYQFRRRIFLLQKSLGAYGTSILAGVDICSEWDWQKINGTFDNETPLLRQVDIDVLLLIHQELDLD